MYILLCFGMMGGGGGGRRATTRGPGGGIGPGTGGEPLWPPELPEEGPEGEGEPEEGRPRGGERPRRREEAVREELPELEEAYFTISVLPKSETVSPGQSARYSLTVTSHNGFSQRVRLSMDRVPEGCIPSFSPVAVSLSPDESADSELTVKTSSRTPTGDHDLTVRGTWEDIEDTDIITLVVE